MTMCVLCMDLCVVASHRTWPCGACYMIVLSLCIKGGSQLNLNSVPFAGQCAIWAHGEVELLGSACTWKWQVRSNFSHLFMLFVDIYCQLVQSLSNNHPSVCHCRAAKYVHCSGLFYFYFYLVLWKDGCQWTHGSLEKGQSFFEGSREVHGSIQHALFHEPFLLNHGPPQWKKNKQVNDRQFCTIVTP